MNFNAYKEKFNFFKSILPENAHIVECGAHYGEDTIRFLYTLPQCTITAFECDPRNYAILHKHLSKEPRCHLHPCALGNENKTTIFYQAYKDEELQDKYKWIGINDFKEHKLGNSGSSSLKKSSRSDLVNSQEILVNMRTLDSYKLSRIDLLWIDVQGAEKDLLKGSKKTLQHTKYIWIECDELTYEDAMTEKETKQFLETLNFKCVKKDKKDLLFINNGFKENN